MAIPLLSGKMSNEDEDSAKKNSNLLHVDSFVNLIHVSGVLFFIFCTDEYW